MRSAAAITRLYNLVRTLITLVKNLFSRCEKPCLLFDQPRSTSITQFFRDNETRAIGLTKMRGILKPRGRTVHIRDVKFMKAAHFTPRNCDSSTSFGLKYPKPKKKKKRTIGAGMRLCKRRHLLAVVWHPSKLNYPVIPPALGDVQYIDCALWSCMANEKGTSFHNRFPFVGCERKMT